MGLNAAVAFSKAAVIYFGVDIFIRGGGEWESYVFRLMAASGGKNP